jgi:hypothetical protein
MPSTWKKGRNLEKEVELMYQKQGFVTWRPPKTAFGDQDIFGIGDIIAMNSQNLILVAVALGRYQTETMRKIIEILPMLPGVVVVKYHVLKRFKDGEKMEVREWKGGAT